jgi:integrase
MSYRQARLYNNKSQGLYIEYATLNDENQYQRCRIRLNRLWKQSSTMADFKVKAESVIMSINNQLQMHYAPMQTMPMVLPNPVQYVPAMQPVMQYAAPLPALPSAQAEQQQAEQAVAPMPTVSEASKPTKRSETPVKKMFEEFIKEKSKELKKTSMVSYSTFCKQLTEWLQKNYPTLTTGDFTQEIAVEYLEFVNRGGNSNGKKVVRTRLHAERVSPRTYNNNMKMGRGVFTWAVEHCYLSENPFAKIKKKREGKKTRTIIPAEDRTRIFNYFKENNPAMCIIMQMVFTSLIRPIEITRIQVEDIDFVNHCIHLPGTNIIAPADLMGYRNHPVYIRGSRHTPLPERAVLDAMRTLCELMKEEENAIVRAILGHFVFVYIHPYMDGNGRTARFIMNSMLVTGGYD